MSGSDILLITLHVITDWPVSAPLVATYVNHQVPAGYSPPSPGDCRVTLTGERPVCKQHRSLSRQQGHAAV
ncbi:unnamed protein product, partial [Staurois parvus]